MNNNVSIWSGNAAGYDAYRPQAPTVLLDILPQLIQEPNPDLVVDIGCGTGLSTFLWADRARQVIGIEPNDDMRWQAEVSKLDLDTKNVQFHAGVSTQTGLPDGCASIVTCSQSLHCQHLRKSSAFCVLVAFLPPMIMIGHPQSIGKLR
jgi:SAM-dependent methyltransferase